MKARFVTGDLIVNIPRSGILGHNYLEDGQSRTAVQEVKNAPVRHDRLKFPSTTTTDCPVVSVV